MTRGVLGGVSALPAHPLFLLVRMTYKGLVLVRVGDWTFDMSIDAVLLGETVAI